MEPEEEDKMQNNNCGCIPRILVVDDTEFNILAVKCMVKENFQLDVDQALNGLIALEMYKKAYEKPCMCNDRTYKLVFMDLQMPVMGGVESATEMMKLVREDVIR